MAKTDTRSDAQESVTPGQASPRITWDDSGMRTSYANVCNVLGTREEVMLLFGANQAWQGGQKETARQWGDAAMAQGADGYLDGGSVPVGAGPVPWQR